VLAVSAALSAAGLAWFAFLLITGGIDVRVFGRAVSSHDPMRPLLLAAVALALHFLAGGDEAFVRRVERSAAAFEGLRWFDGFGIAVLAAVVAVVGVTKGSKLADGSDVFGYVSEADLFLGGELAVHQPWIHDVPWPEAQWSFSPLGYRPGPATASFSFAGYQPAFDPSAIVPTYSPGLPILLAAAKWIGGHCALFSVVPLTGAVLVLTTFGIGCRLGSPRLGVVAAFFVATSPTVLRYLLTTMSDVPVAAAWTLAWWCVLGRTWWSAAGAGSALAITVLIRPNLVPLAALVPLWTWWCVIRDRSDRRRQIGRALTVTAGLAAGVVATAGIYWVAYGSPAVSGYGDVSNLFGVGNILPNLRNYSLWFLQEGSLIAYCGVVALFIPSKRLWPGVPDRRLIWMFAATLIMLLAQFSYFAVFENAAYLRFFLPAYPFIMLGLASLALLVARAGRLAAVGVTFFVLVFGLAGVRHVSEVFGAWKYDATLLGLYERVRAVTNESSVVIAMQHSGGARYHAGRVTLRYDSLPADWLDRAVAWMSDRGVRTYVLIDDWELPFVRKRFAGQALAAAFERPPAMATTRAYFYDLAGPPVDKTELVTGAASNRCAPALPLPTIAWKTKTR